MKKDDVYKEFIRLSDLIERAEGLEDKALLDLNKQFLDFIKKHRKKFKFTDEQIAQGEELYDRAVKACEKAKISEAIAIESKLQYEKALAELDDTLAAESLRLGRPVMLPAESSKKYRGN